MKNPNLALLSETARLLKPLLDEIVFVGGCTTALLITDEGAAGVRPTYDVDVIAEISSKVEYLHFSSRLRRLGFREDKSEGAPLCRWRHPPALVLDVMPLDESVLGFSNRWYPGAMRTAVDQTLEEDLRLRIVTAPYFCGTKLEAFRGRGRGDYAGSHDLEDLVAVIDGRPELTDEISATDADLRSAIAADVAGLLDSTRFRDALPGYLLPDSASQARIPLLLERLRMISRL
jgi:hypothetical protein